MLKKKLNKTLFFSLALILVFTSLAACTSKNNEATPTPAVSAPPMELEAWVANETVTNDAVLFQEINKAFNVKLETKIRGAGAQDYLDKLNLQITSGEIPDWINDQAISIPVFDQYIEQDVLAEIPVDMIKENMPNYMAWVEKYKNIFGEDPFKLYERSGKNYSIPTAYPVLSQFTVMYYRQDWLNGVGITKAPETLVEMEDALTKMKDKYGYAYTGIHSDPIWTFSPMFGAYGLYPGWFTEKNGKVVRDEVAPEMKEVLTLLNDWYNKGIIDKEWMTLDFVGSRDKLVAGKISAIWQNIYAGKEGDFYSGLKDTAPEASLLVASAPKGPNGDYGTFSFNPLAGVGILFGKQLEEQPEKMAKYLQIFDKVATDMNWLEIRDYGIEGVHYKNENGNYDWLPPYDQESERNKVGLGLGVKFPSLESVFFDVEKEFSLLPNQSDREYLVDAQSKANGKYDVLAPFAKPKWDAISTELNAITTKALTDFITGKRPISEFDDYVNEWMSKGGKEALEEAQTIYDSKF